MLTRTHDLRSTAAEASTIVDRYKTNLFGQLDLPLSLPKTRIRIDVRERRNQASAPQTDTIHRLQWELLEDPHHWHNFNPCITVRRIVTPADTSPELKRVCSWSTSDSINILLVVARRLENDQGREHHGVIPSSALSAIQNAQKQLNTRRSSPRIKLEIVRPGTYQALQGHLEKSTREIGHGYFHMVHLDLHGLVKNHTPYLYFANEDGNLVEKPALDVAELLAANGVSSAVINACESATASKGMDANLSQTSALKRISSILAMSYKISSSAATIFLSSFYRNLLNEILPFSEAAGRARETLREQREREGRCSLRCDIQDWFVPVMYMGNRDLQISPRSSQLSGSPVSWKRSRSILDCWTPLIFEMDRWLSMVLLYKSRLLTICSSSVFAPLSSSQSSAGRAGRRLSLADKAKCRPKMICLKADTFDDQNDCPDTLVLDDFILNLENRMIIDHHIFIHGPTTAGKSPFLDQLSQLWLSTNFVERVYVIQARRFLDGWIPGLLRCLLHSIQGHSKFLYATASLPRNKDEKSNPEPRVVVIVDHLDQLFSNDLTAQQKARAKACLDAFLLKVVEGTRVKSHTPPPYLILVGRKGDDWLHQHFGDLDLDPTPIFLNSRPALHHLQ